MRLLKRFAISIRWRSYRWQLTGLARSSADLVAGLVEHLPFGASVTVKREDSDADEARAARDREEYARDMEPYTRAHRDGDVTP